MSDIHIHPHYEEKDSIDHRGTIRDNWVTDTWGFVTSDFAVECMFRHGVSKFMDVESIKRPFPVICKYPDEIHLDDSNL